jgi:hypothetical protein
MPRVTQAVRIPHKPQRLAQACAAQCRTGSSVTAVQGQLCPGPKVPVCCGTTLVPLCSLLPPSISALHHADTCCTPNLHPLDLFCAGGRAAGGEAAGARAPGGGAAGAGPGARRAAGGGGPADVHQAAPGARAAAAGHPADAPLLRGACCDAGLGIGFRVGVCCCPGLGGLQRLAAVAGVAERAGLHRFWEHPVSPCRCSWCLKPGRHTVVLRPAPEAHA